MVFTVFGLSLVLSLAIVLLATPSILEPDYWNDPESLLILFVSLMLLVLGCLPLFKMKRIRIEPHRMVYQNYLFGSQMKDVDLKYYDYYKIVHEESENGIFEAVWLIKNDKLADSFSTYQYVNYDAMEIALPVKYEGELVISPFRQMLIKLGAKI